MTDPDQIWSRRLDEVQEAFRLEREAMHNKLDHILVAFHHLMTKGLFTMDHAAVLDLAKVADKAVDDKVSAAVSGFEALAASHQAKSDSLDDIGAILQGIPAKLGKLDEIKLPADAEMPADMPAMPAASVTASVAAATTAPTSTVVVTGDAPVPVDSTLAGPGIVPGTTASDVAVTTAVDGSAVSTITLSQPTTDDHVGDQTEQIVATPATAS